ncbi:MAG: tetratricopeptide repeat protein [Polyangiaceae bacterium]|nr:tetratricopeptide repeat protein [Polyangiaceae bacterium]
MPTEREKIVANAQRFVDKKKFDRAIEEYQKLVQTDPSDARTWLKIGDLQARTGAIRPAIATYERVGEQYSAQGFALKAIAVYKQIRELIKKQAPELSDHYTYLLPKLGAIYAELGLVSDALSAYDEMAAFLQRTQRDGEAIAIFQKMVELNRENPLPHLRLAEACCRVQRLEDAVQSFWHAAELLLQMQRNEDALKVVERILHFQQDVRFARVAAELYLKKGDRESGLQALAKLQVCFQADPKNMDTLALLAQAFNMIGQEGKSVEVYKEMARIAREQGQVQLYQQLVEHLRSTAPNDEQVRDFRTLHPNEAEASVRSQHPAAGSVRSRNPSAGSVRSQPPTGAGTRSNPPADLIESLDDDLELVEEVEPNSTQEASQLARPRAASEPDVELVDDDFVEAASEPPISGPSEQRALLDAESFRRLRLHDKAVGVLHRALESAPDSLELRLKLLEVLVEMGDRESAVLEQVNVATLYIHLGDLRTAEPLLYEVLEASPEQPDAVRLLRDFIEVGRPPHSARPQRPTPDSNRQIGAGEALPSFDLEEVSAAQTLATDDEAAGSLSEIDDPFEGGLPSFPLSGDEAPTRQVRHSFSSTPPGSAEAIEEVLEEAEFFGSQGLWEDARGILAEQLSRNPHHPLLLERLREVEEAMAGSNESQTIERSSLSALARPRGTFQNLDISSSLEALDSLELAGGAAVFEVRNDADVDRVFANFRSGVAGQVAENDSSSHYDLGLAYKEMGLINEALAEFSVAAKDAKRQCNCFAMIGMIHLERGDHEAALAAYQQALQAPEKTREQEVALNYDLGVVSELQGNSDQAISYFKQVTALDPDFRGARDRLLALEGRDSGTVSSKRALENQDDLDLDDAFGELLDTKQR